MPISTRHDWYQTETNVVLNLFVKATTDDVVNVKVTDDNRLQITVRDESLVDILLSHPVEKIVAKSCRPAKIEVKLSKLADTACHWTSLESTGQPATVSTSPPSYPTSSTSGKNWSAVEKEINAAEDDKPEGDAAVNDLFQTIYKDASDETRRAMMKSFTESNGTVLSTNWNEVGKGKVDCKPPDGMEYKKYST